jgi:mannose-1-phosphate guanylyltransferase
MAEAFRSERTAVILAGGNGTRLGAFTREIFGEEVPKQFCRLWGKDTLLEQTWRRTALLIEPSRTLTVLTANHARFYEPLLTGMNGGQAAIQPLIRGTAPAILYALMRLKKIAPNCAVALFPSDHFVSDDRAFMRHVEAAFRAVDARPEETILLGIEPADADPDYGWVEAGPFLTNVCEPVRHVVRFWEKPAPKVAQQLLWRGCLWNSLVMVARLSTFLGLFLITLPELHKSFTAIESEIGTASEQARVQRLYGRISPSDFSREVLARCPINLAVLQVSGVQWSDLGEPRRVTRLFAGRGLQPLRDGVRFAQPATRSLHEVRYSALAGVRGKMN